jgi:hypothetical protein
VDSGGVAIRGSGLVELVAVAADAIDAGLCAADTRDAFFVEKTSA